MLNNTSLVKCNQLDETWEGLVKRFGVVLPLEDLKKVIFIKCPDRVLKQKTGYLMLFTEPIETPVKGFFIIPGFTKYAISKDGYVFSIKKWERVQWVTNAYGYFTVNIYDEDKAKYRAVALHILLARTFLPNSDWTSRFIVNHRDGNKKNNRLENLQWCTSRENNEHARKEGLSTGLKMTCLVKDLADGMIKTYPTTKEAFADLGLAYSLPVRLTSPGELPLVLFGRYEFKLQDEDRGWFYTGVDDDRIFSKTNYNFKGPYEAKKVSEGTVVTAETIKDLAKLIGLSTSTIRQILSYEKPVSVGGYLVRVKSFEPWPAQFEVKRFFPPIEVIVSREGDENEMFFKSLTSAAKFLKLSKGVAEKMLRNGSVVNGWKIRSISPVIE